MAKDLKLTSDGNFELACNDLQLVEENSEFVRQKLQIRLRFFKGEWYLDTEEGVPYLQEVLEKQPDIIVVDNIFKEVILATPGVDSLENFESDYDSATRDYQLSFKVFTTDGDIITMEEGV